MIEHYFNAPLNGFSCFVNIFALVSIELMYELPSHLQQQNLLMSQNVNKTYILRFHTPQKLLCFEHLLHHSINLNTYFMGTWRISFSCCRLELFQYLVDKQFPQFWLSIEFPKQTLPYQQLIYYSEIGQEELVIFSLYTSASTFASLLPQREKIPIN